MSFPQGCLFGSQERMWVWEEQPPESQSPGPGACSSAQLNHKDGISPWMRDLCPLPKCHKKLSEPERKGHQPDKACVKCLFHGYAGTGFGPMTFLGSNFLLRGTCIPHPCCLRLFIKEPHFESGSTFLDFLSP